MAAQAKKRTGDPTFDALTGMARARQAKPQVPTDDGTGVIERGAYSPPKRQGGYLGALDAIDDTARYYLGPHMSEAVGRAAGAASMFGPQADMAGALNEGRQIGPNLAQGNVSGAIGNAGWGTLSAMGLHEVAAPMQAALVAGASVRPKSPRDVFIADEPLRRGDSLVSGEEPIGQASSAEDARRLVQEYYARTDPYLARQRQGSVLFEDDGGVWSVNPAKDKRAEYMLIDEDGKDLLDASDLPYGDPRDMDDLVRQARERGYEIHPDYDVEHAKPGEWGAIVARPLARQAELPREMTLGERIAAFKAQNGR